jgi:hypothetical protein
MRKLTVIAALAAPLLALAQTASGPTGTTPGVGTPGALSGTQVPDAGSTMPGLPTGSQGAIQGGTAGAPTTTPAVPLCPPGTVPDSGLALGAGARGSAAAGPSTATGAASGASGLGATAGSPTGTGITCAPVGAQ